MKLTSFKLRGLWQHSDFLRLWTGQTISVFGSVIGGTAMSFTAILFLQATPVQMGLLNAMQIVPALAAGLFAGAWADRLRRRPLLIAADFGRALVLASIPLAAALGLLGILQMYLVALVVSVLGMIFDVAYQSYLPVLVGKEHLLEGNSKLSASAAVSEFAGFSIGGWLVQLFTGPLAILADAVSFLVSAFSVGLIRAPEPVFGSGEHPDMGREIAEGLKTVRESPLLAASGVVMCLESLSNGVYGAVVVLFMSRDLGFDPGLLGMTWAVGGVASLAGATLSPRATRAGGIGRVMVIGLLVSTLTSALIPLAIGATQLSLVLMILAQLGDGFATAYEINNLSFRQSVAGAHVLGRVNATMRFISLAAMLAGSLLGGWLGQAAGLRSTLWIGVSFRLLAGIFLAFSPLAVLKKV